MKWLAAFAALGLTATLAQASTFVSGTVAGTWTKTGSPYIATGNLSVPSGQTLAIQPGVTLIMGQGLNMNVDGAVSAIGSPAEPIIIRGANSSLYWDKIYVNYRGADSTFFNCIISDATNALYLAIDGQVAGSSTMRTSIRNCAFSNCIGSCIYGYSHGYAYNSGQGWWREEFPGLSPTVFNCLFVGATNGCSFLADGMEAYLGIYSLHGRGAVNPQILNCDSVSLAGVAINFDAGSHAATSYPTVQNNVFLQCGTAMRKSSLTLFNDVTAYNCFFNNSTDFAGFPAGVYGVICCVNNNGTPCDLVNNIFQDPKFVSQTDYHLQPNSPCIDAGTPDWNCSDMCFPPSQGVALTDLGAYGGPDAANWLPSVPLISAQATITRTTNGIVTVSWGAIPRSEYQVQWTSNLLSTVTNWFSVANGWVRATEKPTSVNVATNPPYAEGYYRVKSLGRKSGY